MTAVRLSSQGSSPRLPTRRRRRRPRRALAGTPYCSRHHGLMKKQGLSPAMVPQFLAQHPQVAAQWQELQQQQQTQQQLQMQQGNYQGGDYDGDYQE